MVVLHHIRHEHGTPKYPSDSRFHQNLAAPLPTAGQGCHASDHKPVLSLNQFDQCRFSHTLLRLNSIQVLYGTTQQAAEKLIVPATNRGCPTDVNLGVLGPLGKAH
jgi:hypothetical protein